MTANTTIHRAIISVGSNIDPANHIAQALAFLTKDQKVLAQTTLEKTKAEGTLNQPDFLNGAFDIETKLTKTKLKQYLRSIEDTLGRIRTTDKNGPRTIDLDIILFDDEELDQDYYRYTFVRRAIDSLLQQRRTRDVN